MRFGLFSYCYCYNFLLTERVGGRVFGEEIRDQSIYRYSFSIFFSMARACFQFGPHGIVGIFGGLCRRPHGVAHPELLGDPFLDGLGVFFDGMEIGELL